MRFSSALLSAALCIAASPSADAFVPSNNNGSFRNHRSFRELSSLAAESEVDLGMTPELKRVTDAFASIDQEQVRYKQLLYMAQTTEEANNLPESSKIPENKVPGCLSTVYVDGTAVYNEEAGDYLINFQGDSDGLMTKGLVALLVRCLSGNTAKAIQKVDPQFIKVARIDQSLTPGRNNGFLNMLQSIKTKAIQLDEAARNGSAPAAASSETATEETEEETADEASKSDAIVAALQALKPESLKVVDSSDGAETRFVVDVVAEAFDGLNVIQRQQLIFMMLGQIMPEIEDLRIASMFTPEEAAKRS
jgi:sulfur transfer protein SufE/stress-induced morphogen